jgi:hypothetical protein
MATSNIKISVNFGIGTFSEFFIKFHVDVYSRRTNVSDGVYSALKSIFNTENRTFIE